MFKMNLFSRFYGSIRQLCVHIILSRAITRPNPDDDLRLDWIDNNQLCFIFGKCSTVG